MLKIVVDNNIAIKKVSDEEKEKHHKFLIDSYIQSHHIRNHSTQTIKREKQFLIKWFQSSPYRLYTWDIMNLTSGRNFINSYTKNLIKTEITINTIRSYLGILSRYFSYVLEHPFVKFNDNYILISKLYGPIDQPISEYDIPKHTYNGEQRGVPIDPENIYSFLISIRNNYLNNKNSYDIATRSRDYTMIVIALESGLRANEILHLEVTDLFFKSYKIQTRYAKGTRGSGKRARRTLFTPFARDTVKCYLKNHRDKIAVTKSKYLFPNKQGKVLKYSSIHKSLREMIDLAKEDQVQILDHMSWHWFRRIFATRFIERFPHQLSALIELLGHTTPNTVHRYIRHSEAWMDNKIQEILKDEKAWPSVGD